MKRVIIYHDDLDGRCAAAIVGRAKRGVEAVYLPMGYGERIDWSAFEGFEKDCDECWIVDYSVAPVMMCKLREMVGSGLYWIDHHPSAIERLKEFSGVLGMRDPANAACMLAWMYCRPQLAGVPPRAVELIADRDMWLFRHGDETRHFCEAMRHQETWPAAAEWGVWLSLGRGAAEVERLCWVGKILLDARMRDLWRAVKRLGREEELAGRKRVLTVNIKGCGELGEIGRQAGYDLVHCYVEKLQDGRLVREHSVYSATGGARAIAEQFGGGGHDGASGWIEEIPPY